MNTRHLTIEWGHCDPAGIVFNPRYFEWFDAATAALFARALGLTKAAMLRDYGLVGIPLVETRASFLAPCAFGDEVRIDSRVTAFRRSSFDVAHRLYRADGTLAVEGAETRVWAGPHPDRPGAMKGLPIPAEVIAKIEALGRGTDGP